jgi:hypothetical protein
MANAKNVDVSAADRIEIFHEEYGNILDAGDTLADLVAATGNYLGRIVGSTTADSAMAKVVEQLAGEPPADPSDWRSILEDHRSSCFSEWPLGQRLHDLAAYAIYGVVLDDGEGETAHVKYLTELVAEAEGFIAATPTAEWCIDSKGESDLARLVRLASNRWALDNDQAIEPAALAAFGGVTEGRIRNMMSGTDRRFTAKEGRIPAPEALAWLNEREGFWNSVWREQRLLRHGTKARTALEQAVFVPVGRDGSVFHPGLLRGAGYTIGEKGSEERVADFGQALAALQHMPSPYWRRPNASGNWSIVAGVRWERLDAADLEILAANPDQRLPETNRA